MIPVLLLPPFSHLTWVYNATREAPQLCSDEPRLKRTMTSDLSRCPDPSEGVNCFTKMLAIHDQLEYKSLMPGELKLGITWTQYSFVNQHIPEPYYPPGGRRATGSVRKAIRLLSQVAHCLDFQSFPSSLGACMNWIRCGIPCYIRIVRHGSAR